MLLRICASRGWLIILALSGSATCVSSYANARRVSSAFLAGNGTIEV
jgi:hypothetical protein